MPSTIELGERNDITLQQGMTFRRAPFATWSTGEPAALVNLTGYEAALDVKDAYGDAGTIIFSLTEGDGLTLNGAAGTIDVEFTAENAALLVQLDGPYVYDLRLEAPSGDVIYLVYGTITVIPRVTVPA